jgi:hypothetical protein
MKNKLHIGLFFLRSSWVAVFTVAALCPAFSQTYNSILSNEEFEDVKQTLVKTIENNEVLLNDQQIEWNLSSLDELFGYEQTDSSFYFKNNVLNAKQYLLSKDYGLKLNASYIEHFGQNIIEDEGFFYNRRAQIGIDWNVLQYGLLANKHQIEVLENQKHINNMLQQQELKNYNYLLFNNIINYSFYKLKVDKLQGRLNILESLFEVTSKLYHYKYVPWESVLDIMSKKARTELKIKNANNYNSNILETDSLFVDAEQLPLLEIDVKKLFDYVKTNATRDTLYGLYAQKLDMENKRFKDMTLRGNFRYNYYQSALTNNRDFFSLGISFAMPLPINRKAHDQLVDAQKQEYRNKDRDALDHEVKEVVNHYYEYENKLIEYYQTYHKQLKIKEWLRKEWVKQSMKDPDYSPVRIINLLEEFIATEHELVDIKHVAYIKLLKVFSYLNTQKVSDFTTVIDIEKEVTKYEQIRSIYIWSKAFEEQEVDFMIEYMRLHQYKKAIVSTGGKDALINKFKLFSEAAIKHGIEVHIMTGDNNLIRPENAGRLKDFVTDAQKLNVKGIHLDVEPHTFADWPEKKGAYLDQFVEMVRSAKEFVGTSSLEISISIPVHYAEDKLKALFPHCDEIYLMAYEHPKIDYIERKIAEEMGIAPTKITIALRTNDFSNRFDFEQFVRDLSEKTGVNKIAVHALKGLLELDEATIKPKNE